MKGFKPLYAILILTILALPALADIRVIGCVQHPGLYNVKGVISIAKALTLAGGALKEANLRDVWVIHPDGSIDRVNAESSGSKVELHPDDVLFVPKSGGMARIGGIGAPVELDDLIESTGVTLKEMLDLTGPALAASKSLLQGIAPSVTPLLSDLSYVRIRKFSSTGDGRKFEELVKKLEERLRSSGWRKIMMSAPVGNYMTALWTLENGKGETIGLLVLNRKDSETQIVNLVGKIDFAKLGDLTSLVRSSPPPPSFKLPKIRSIPSVSATEPFTGSPSIMRAYNPKQAEEFKRTIEQAWRYRMGSRKSLEVVREALEDAMREVKSDSVRMRIRDALGMINKMEMGRKVEGKGYLGVRVYDLREIDVKKLKTAPYRRGAVVSKVYKGSPADRAGIKVRDVILAFNGREVRGKDDLVNAVLSSKPGDKAQVELIRKGEKLKVEVEIGERPVE